MCVGHSREWKLYVPQGDTIMSAEDIREEASRVLWHLNRLAAPPPKNTTRLRQYAELCKVNPKRQRNS